MRTAPCATAVAVVLAVVAIGAQAGQAPQSPTTPKKLLYDMGNWLGMLRGLAEQDSIITMEYWGEGDLTVSGEQFKVTNYRGSVDWTVPGMRVDYVRTAPGGQAQRRIHVVAGKHAWDETDRGVNASPTPQALNERLLQVWSLPAGIVKAATAAGANLKISVEGSATVVTFPVPGVDGGTIKAFLNKENRAERVEARAGNVVTETTYSDYGDWNDADMKSDVFFPRRIVQKQSGVTVLNLTVSRTNTYNPYMVVRAPQEVVTTSAQ